MKRFARGFFILWISLLPRQTLASGQDCHVPVGVSKPLAQALKETIDVAKVKTVQEMRWSLFSKFGPKVFEMSSADLRYLEEFTARLASQGKINSGALQKVRSAIEGCYAR